VCRSGLWKAKACGSGWLGISRKFEIDFPPFADDKNWPLMIAYLVDLLTPYNLREVPERRGPMAAASSPSMQGVRLASDSNPSFYEKLNTTWHKRALLLFMFIVLAHWAEHLAQAWQIYYMGWPRPKAGGFLGLFFPWLVTSESLHYGYALVMLVFLWVLRKGFTGLSRKWWTVALVIQFWHHIEHALLQGQALFHHNLFHSPVPVSILQLAMPKNRVELHLFYNGIVFIPMMIAMYYHTFPPEREADTAKCTCALRPQHQANAMAV
jgi:hypothetical protein